ncbi:AzlC family ABC transporter permease [Clostridioides difficile]|uniref:AzlC family ABC transporter permease n=1 Tax=Clostridioides difficile TaxID=1496 RepID=UPI000235AC55|nr:AzlC family ABC transporter permease [Clostridioides difficile]EHJ26895.1 AzlC protein [Clostridioides difficile 050-P50-2011]
MERTQQLRESFIASIPIFLGYIPIGIVGGILLQKSGLSPFQIALMVTLVFGGSSQFIAASMISTGASVTSIVLTTFIVNLRHFLMSSNLNMYIKNKSPKFILPFCHTITDETVVLLSHKKPDGHINVKVEFGEGEGKVPLDNIVKRAEAYKPKERVTYKKIKEYIEAKYGFKVHTAYIAEVKRSLGLPMYDAPNAVEELKQPRKHPTAEKVEAIKDALKYFEVI